jgi:hypothetical protein
MEAVHKSERDPMVVALHTRQTLAAVDIHPVHELKEMSEVPSISWVEARGSRTAVRLERAPVAMEVGTGEESQGRAREEAVGNTEVPEEVAEVL